MKVRTTSFSSVKFSSYPRCHSGQVMNKAGDSPGSSEKDSKNLLLPSDLVVSAAA